MIHRVEPEDVGGLARLIGTIFPDWVTTERGLRHWMHAEPERARLAIWVALADGEVVGWSEARHLWEFEGDSAFLLGGVHPERRGRRLGGALYDLAEGHVERAGRLYSFAQGEEGGRFLLERGFREDRADRISVLDPRTVDLSALPRLEAEHAAAGFRTVPLREVRDRGPELHEVFEAVDADAPHPEPPVPIEYREWKRLVIDEPDLDDEASAVVLAPDGRAVGLSWLLVDREGGRAVVEMTGVLREFRRRGLARLVKLVTIRWAAEHGVTAMFTGNDTENRAMLALNDELGFEPRILHQEYVKELR